MYCRLPVSGNEVSLRLPCGKEDLLLCEWKGGETALAQALLNAITDQTAGQDAFEWGELSVTDFEWTLLLLRRSLFGDWVRTSSICKQADCAAKVDISFRIGDYLEQFQINRPASVEPSPEPGWFSLAGKDIKFRFPTGNDQQAVAQFPQPELELQRRCVVPDMLPEDLLQQVQDSLESMAPTISGLLRGECPECGGMGDFYLDVQSYVLSELLDQAKFVFEDVHLLAGHYHWSEEAILNLPRQRRHRYVEAIIRDRGVA
ncbi:MAG: hypothetical protein PHE55_05935 [Methylococcaceae bacterium]|nr:hypothetical protein [Methylococcaceae bacterium]